MIEMAPLLSLDIPPTTGRNNMEMRVVLPIAAMRLDHDDVATLEGLAADPAKDIIQAGDPTPHERAQ